LLHVVTKNEEIEKAAEIRALKNSLKELEEIYKKQKALLDSDVDKLLTVDDHRE